MKKYAITMIVAVILGYIGMNYSGTKEGLLEQTIKYNNGVYKSCFVEKYSMTGQGSSGSIKGDNEIFRQATNCWQSQRKLTPDDLFLTVPRSLVDNGQCSISQSEDDHVNKVRGGMYATDLACNFKAQGVYAPDYLDQMIEYKIDSVGFDTLLGNFVILSFKDNNQLSKQSSTRWYFGHTTLDAQWKVGDTVNTGVRFAHANLSGATTGWHTHIELRRSYDGIWQSVRYVTRGKERKLEEKRISGLVPVVSAAEIENNTYYFTHYDLGDISQNDASPCIGSSGKDLCYLARNGVATMALTSDIRKQMGIQFGDNVTLVGDEGCSGTYQVEDEMNIRFRKTPGIKRPGTNLYIKGDLPGQPGGACTVTKL